MSEERNNMPIEIPAVCDLPGSASPQSFHKDVGYSDMEFGDIVGRGAFGIVYKALWKGIQVAVKIMEGDDAPKALNKEVHQLSQLRHENIIRLYGVCSQKPKVVCLVMEYAENGSLYDILHPSGSDVKQCDYTIGHVMSWALQCAKAMEYLHGLQPNPVIHRDLKPPNMLLKEHGTVLKICDFGTARELDSSHLTSNKGSAAWMAPEVFEGPVYSGKCDVFSFGIVLWEMITRQKPFDEIGPPPFRIMWAVHRGKRPPLIRGIPMIFENLMNSAWNKDSKMRPPFSVIVAFLEKASKFVAGFNTPLKIPVARDDENEQYTSSESEPFQEIARELSFSSGSTEKVSITGSDKVQYEKISAEEKPVLPPELKTIVCEPGQEVVVTEFSGSIRTVASPDPSGRVSVSPVRPSDQKQRCPEQLMPLSTLRESTSQQNLDTADANDQFHARRTQSYTDIRNLPEYDDVHLSASPNISGHGYVSPNDGWIMESRLYGTPDDMPQVLPGYPARSMQDIGPYVPPSQGYKTSPDVQYGGFPPSPAYPRIPYSSGVRTRAPGDNSTGYQVPLWINRWSSPTIPEHTAIDELAPRQPRRHGSDQAGNDNVFLPAYSGPSNYQSGRSSLEVSSSSSNRSSGNSSPINSLHPMPIRKEFRQDNASPRTQRIFSDYPIIYDNPAPHMSQSASEGRYEENLWHLIDPEIMPLRPINNSKESMAIYEKHSKLIHEYIDLQKDIEYLLERKREIEQRLDDERREQQRSSMFLEEYLKLLEEKQSLSAYLNTLKEELQQRSSFLASGENML